MLFNICFLTISQVGFAQEHLLKGDKILYLFDIGPTNHSNEIPGLSMALNNYNLPKISKATHGIQVGTDLYMGKRLIIGTSFMHYDASDSINLIKLIQRNFQYNIYWGYNIIRSKHHERFSIIPQLGLFTQRTTLLLNQNSSRTLETKIDGLNYSTKKGGNKIIRNNTGIFTSIRINYALRTGSLLDIFTFGLESGIKYSLTPHKNSAIKRGKFFYRTSEKQLNSFVTLHFRIPLFFLTNIEKEKF